MTDPISVALRDVAGTRMFVRNAFRLTELPTNATRQTVLHRKQKVATTSQVDPDLVSAEALGAFDRILGDPRHRLIDEILWLWDTQDLDCDCPVYLHHDHDAAVLAHSEVLEREAGTEAVNATDMLEVKLMWSETARLWERALRRAAFWDHVRHRIAALGDRQLDESVVEVLREELPIALVKSLIQVTATATGGNDWRAEVARAWPAPIHVINDLLGEAASPLFETVQEATDEAARRLEAGEPHVAAGQMDKLDTVLRRMNDLLPADQHRRTAITRNAVAVVYNNCANRLMERDGTVQATTCQAWLCSARALASNAETIRTITHNEMALAEVVEAIADIQRRVDRLVRQGKTRLAISVLLDIRRRTVGEWGAADIERMLADLDNKQQVGDHSWSDPSLGSRYTRMFERFHGGRSAIKLSVALAIATLMLVGWLLIQFWPEGERTMPVDNNEASENAAVGTCVVSRDGWLADKLDVPVVGCAEEHWGEVLAYPLLGKASSPYPGVGKVEALARFKCAYALAEQGLSTEKYTTTMHVHNEGRWSEQESENYASCVLHRKGDEPLPNRQLVDPSRSPENVSVQMDRHGSTITAGPPAGACFQSESARDTMYDVSVVPCNRPHWAEILGYHQFDPLPPELPEQVREVVYAEGERACQEMAEEYDLPLDTRTTVLWPDEAWWDDQARGVLYATCVAHRVDNEVFEGALA